ncbi:MAG: hypothetical protein ABIU09_12725 [Pyrinomonadaceae bacterium]
MKSICTAIFCLIFSLNLASCSSIEEKSAKQKNASDSSERRANANSIENDASPANKETGPVTEEFPTADETAGSQRKSKMEAMRREAENSPPPKIDIETELKKSTIPAPENSEFGAVLADIVFERRTFKSHPQLLKVEKTTKGNVKAIKVYLKDGSVVDLPGEKIEFISKATSASILQSAGIGAPSDARRPNSKPK